jgi:hypothetical protein
MSEFPVYRSLEELDAEEGGKELPSFDVDLFDAMNPDEDFRTQNNPHDPYQRTDVVQRRGAVFIKCKCVDVIHGTWEAGSSQKASLVVLSFRFYPRKPGRRIKHAEMEFRFTSMDPSARRQPEVAEMSLDGHYSLVPTTRSEEHTTGVEGTAGGGALGLELSSTLKWEQKITEETTAATYVAGGTFTDPEWLSTENSVSWSVTENEHRKSGIPAAMRVGILVKRPNDEDFQCSVKLKTSADFKTEWQEVFKKHQGDDALIFKPSLPPTNTLMKYDTKNLGSFNMADIEQVTMTTVREDAIKTMKTQA